MIIILQLQDCGLPLYPLQTLSLSVTVELRKCGLAANSGCGLRASTGRHMPELVGYLRFHSDVSTSPFAGLNLQKEWTTMLRKDFPACLSARLLCGNLVISFPSASLLNPCFRGKLESFEEPLRCCRGRVCCVCVILKWCHEEGQLSDLVYQICHSSNSMKHPMLSETEAHLIPCLSCCLCQCKKTWSWSRTS